MAHQIKIATCCYCGRRTSLQNTARGGHALACGSCGAPLHQFKALKVSSTPKSTPKHEPPGYPERRSDRPKPRKSKKRKPLWKKALGEVFDVVEDIFD